MEMQTIIINTTDNDGDSYFQAELGVYRMKRCGNLAELNIWNKAIHPKMATKDPMGEALTDYFIQLLKSKKGRLLVMIGNASFVVQASDGKYSLNGKQLPRKRISYVLGKVLYKSVFEDDVTKLIMYSHDLIETPQEVTYVLENRMPYYFYRRATGRTEVRLNVVRVGDKECAIEIGDGVWGTMSFADIKSFCLAYDQRSNRTNKWSRISPAELYERTTGKSMDINSSDYKVLISFLEQNRTQKIVEERAKKLVMDIAKKYDNIEVLSKADTLTMLIKGRENYWRVEGNVNNMSNQAGRQNVRSYVLQEHEWKGPICIDNANTHSSLGDQLVARALPMMNDHILAKMISTVSSYARESEVGNYTFDKVISYLESEGYEKVQSL